MISIRYIIFGAALAELPFLSLACSTHTHVRVEGHRLPAAVATNQLLLRMDVPYDHWVLGTVHASCERKQRDCSEFELLRHMRQAAAASGSTAFVAPRCIDESKGTTAMLCCRATMARALALGDPASSHSDAPQEMRWQVRIAQRRILVIAHPRANRHPPRTDSVFRHDIPPENAIKLGSVHASCSEPCERGDAEKALEIGASGLGANSLSEIRCLEQQAYRWHCQGVASFVQPSPPTNTTSP
ncbi:MAG TPA: hypothetical protein PLJ27_05690 [Polyangiaceae bacterium]|nr:hypothetical protein [Polyangiaceae bacterium]HNZ22453.1 hypothetical protein [Polyangiaceae bacterium]HOD23535.1 hypothetical protein [Polyangiaceae bacterium]HOE51350.1 hypothetical protein [Polyangiaceae bacterium]HOH00242.1 hypothetical protein [Polyangiaceae bacterium]